MERKDLLDSLRDMNENTCADMFERMPGVANKIISRLPAATYR